jgi:hypothetical protein
MGPKIHKCLHYAYGYHKDLNVQNGKQNIYEEAVHLFSVININKDVVACACSPS